MKKRLFFILSILIITSIALSLYFFQRLDNYKNEKNENHSLQNPEILIENDQTIRKAKIDKIQIEILNIDIVSGRFPKKDHQYLDLEIQITNNSSENIEINSVFNMELRDPKGKIYSDHSIFTNSDGFNINIEPKNLAISKVSFEVPKNSKKLTLYYFPDFLKPDNFAQIEVLNILN